MFGDRSAVTQQGRLRGYLLAGRDAANCDLCGRRLPASLQVAAHIVPRSVSDEDHRKDFAAIAMLACNLGCDELFELSSRCHIRETLGELLRAFRDIEPGVTRELPVLAASVERGQERDDVRVLSLGSVPL